VDWLKYYINVSFHEIMPESTVSISQTARDTLLQLAEVSGESVQAILEKAIENYRRTVFLSSANLAFATLKANQAAWQEELEERQNWDLTLADGLEE
jgi:hypothetical protein